MQFVTNPCIVCQKRSTLEIDRERYERWAGGELVQNVWPEWTPDEREMLITGTHGECWEAMFSEEEKVL
jgi:hypothetical protein